MQRVRDRIPPIKNLDTAFDAASIQGKNDAINALIRTIENTAEYFENQSGGIAGS